MPPSGTAVMNASDMVSWILGAPSAAKTTSYQTNFPNAYQLLNSSATIIGSLGSYNGNTLFGDSLIAAIFTLVENQDDNSVAIDGPLTTIATQSGLTRTIQTQSDLDTVMSRDITVDSPYEQFIVSHLTLMSAGSYIMMSDESGNIEDLNGPLPSYYTSSLSNFTPKVLRGVMVRLGIDSMTHQNQMNSMTCEMLNLGITIDFTQFKQGPTSSVPCTAQTTCLATPMTNPCYIDYVNSTDPNVKIYTKVLLVGLYYYSWVGWQIFNI